VSYASADDLYAVIRLLRPLLRCLNTSVEASLKRSNYSAPSRAVLETLHTGGPQTVPSLARALLVKRQFTQRTVNRLSDDGLIERRRNPANQKSWLFVLTPQGAEAFATIRGQENEIWGNMAANLPAAEVDSCRRVLDEITRKLVARGRARGEASNKDKPGEGQLE
jgi:DNA-binding MarR family transcriptional regulator